MRSVFLLLIAWLGWSATSAAAIDLDGHSLEPEWQQAQVFDDFRVTDTGNFSVPPYKTVLRILPLPDALYIALYMEYPVERRTYGRSARDVDTVADPAFIFIDFEGQGRTAYNFTFSLSGSQRDAVLVNQSTFVNEWDAVWYVGISENQNGWQGELKIPWTVAPTGARSGDTRTIGFLAGRYVRDAAHEYAYPAIRFPSATYVQDFKKITVPRYATSQLEMFPYVVAMSDRLNSRTTGRAGADLFWFPNESHRLGATLNPDFGQIESDDLVVNFSAIETFFNDRRPFFTERLELFDVRAPKIDRLVHTRRIGASPDVGPGSATDVAAAIKYTGNIGPYEIGSFLATEDSSVVAQGRFFGAGRWRLKNEEFALGYLTTFARRPDLERSAQVHAVDFDWRPGNRLSVSGQMIASDISDRPDAVSATKYDRMGYGGWATLSYERPGHLRQIVTAKSYGRDLEFNDMGYQERPGIASLSTFTELVDSDFDAASPVRTSTWELELLAQENSNGDSLRDNAELRHRWRWEGGSSTVVTGALQDAGIDDLISRRNGYVHLPTYRTLGIRQESAQVGSWRWVLEGSVFEDGLSSSIASRFESKLIWTPYDELSISATARYVHSPDWLIWLRDEEFGSYRRAELYGLLGVDWYPANRHEVRLRLQYIGLEANLRRPLELDVTSRLREVGRFERNFTVANLGLQLRYRYEFMPLRELYLVYSRGGATSDEEYIGNTADRFRQSWNRVVSHQAIAKIRYRF